MNLIRQYHKRLRLRISVIKIFSGFSQFEFVGSFGWCGEKSYDNSVCRVLKSSAVECKRVLYPER